MNLPLFFFFGTCSVDIFSHLKEGGKKITTFNVAFFSDTIKARSFKLHVIITLLGVYFDVVDLVT